MKSSDTNDWSTPYIQYSTRKKWHLMFSNDPIYLTGGMVAQIVTNATSKNYSMEDSIQYLLDRGFSEGKTGKTIDGFNQGDQLTRAEAITFIQRLKQNLGELQSSSSIERKYIPIPANFPTSKTEKIDKFINLTENAEIYQTPSGSAKILGILAPQSVQAFEKKDNWYHIHSSWLGDMWIFATDQNSADFNVIDPNDNRAVGNITVETNDTRRSYLNGYLLLKDAPYKKNNVTFNVYFYTDKRVLSSVLRNCYLTNMTIGDIQEFNANMSGFVSDNNIKLEITHITDAEAQS